MKVSVVTPVYNMRGPLERCIESFRAQTEEDIEFILVDDGSTDGSGELCEVMAHSDARFKALHQDNGGPGAARNRGLAAASGSWIVFVDADDFIEPGYVARLLAAQSVSHADIVVSDCLVRDESGEHPRGGIETGRVLRNNDEVFNLLFAGQLPWSVWGKLYRADYLKGVRFERSMRIAEDLEFNARVFAHPGLVVATVSDCGYRHVINAFGLERNFALSHLRQFEAFERVVRIVKQAHIFTEISPEVFYEECVLACLRKAAAFDALTPEVVLAFKRAIKLYRGEVLREHGAPASTKKYLRATMLGLPSYLKIDSRPF